MFELTSVNIEAWLSTLSTSQLNDLSDTVDKYENMGLNDTIVKAYSGYIQEMRNLKDPGTNNNLSTTLQKSFLMALHTPPKVTFGGIAHPHQKSFLVAIGKHDTPNKSHFWCHCTPPQKLQLVPLHTPQKVTSGAIAHPTKSHF